MERKFLEEFGLGKAEIDKIMAAHGAGLERVKKKMADAVLERDGLAQQLLDTQQELAALSGLNPQAVLGEAQARETALAAEAEALRAELEGERYAGQVRLAAAGEKFSSAAARGAFETALLEAKLPVENGKLTGYGDFREAFMARDPGAFAPSGPVPRIVAPVAPAPKTSGWREKAARNYERAHQEQGGF